MSRMNSGILNFDSVAPSTEVAIPAPDFVEGRMVGGQTQVGAPRQQVGPSSGEAGYAALAQIAGGVAKGLDNFADIGSRIEKSKIQKAQLLFDEIDNREDLDGDTKFSQFEEGIKDIYTPLLGDSWRKDMDNRVRKQWLSGAARDTFEQNRYNRELGEFITRENIEDIRQLTPELLDEFQREYESRHSMAKNVTWFQTTRAQTQANVSANETKKAEATIEYTVATMLQPPDEATLNEYSLSNDPVRKREIEEQFRGYFDIANKVTPYDKPQDIYDKLKNYLQTSLETTLDKMSPDVRDKVILSLDTIAARQVKPFVDRAIAQQRLERVANSATAIEVARVNLTENKNAPEFLTALARNVGNLPMEQKSQVLSGVMLALYQSFAMDNQDKHPSDILDMAEKALIDWSNARPHPEAENTNGELLERSLSKGLSLEDWILASKQAFMQGEGYISRIQNSIGLVSSELKNFDDSAEWVNWTTDQMNGYTSAFIADLTKAVGLGTSEKFKKYLEEIVVSNGQLTFPKTFGDWFAGLNKDLKTELGERGLLLNPEALKSVHSAVIGLTTVRAKHEQKRIKEQEEIARRAAAGEKEPKKTKEPKTEAAILVENYSRTEEDKERDAAFERFVMPMFSSLVSSRVPEKSAMLLAKQYAMANIHEDDRQRRTEQERWQATQGFKLYGLYAAKDTQGNYVMSDEMLPPAMVSVRNAWRGPEDAKRLVYKHSGVTPSSFQKNGETYVNQDGSLTQEGAEAMMVLQLKTSELLSSAPKDSYTSSFFSEFKDVLKQSETSGNEIPLSTLYAIHTVVKAIEATGIDKPQTLNAIGGGSDDRGTLVTVLSLVEGHIDLTEGGNTQLARAGQQFANLLALVDEMVGKGSLGTRNRVTPGRGDQVSYDEIAKQVLQIHKEGENEYKENVVLLPQVFGFASERDMYEALGGVIGLLPWNTSSEYFTTVGNTKKPWNEFTDQEKLTYAIGKFAEDPNSTVEQKQRALALLAKVSYDGTLGGFENKLDMKMNIMRKVLAKPDTDGIPRQKYVNQVRLGTELVEDYTLWFDETVGTINNVPTREVSQPNAFGTVSGILEHVRTKVLSGFTAMDNAPPDSKQIALEAFSVQSELELAAQSVLLDTEWTNENYELLRSMFGLSYSPEYALVSNKKGQPLFDALMLNGEFKLLVDGEIARGADPRYLFSVETKVENGQTHAYFKVGSKSFRVPDTGSSLFTEKRPAKRKQRRQDVLDEFTAFRKKQEKMLGTLGVTTKQLRNKAERDLYKDDDKLPWWFGQ